MNLKWLIARELLWLFFILVAVIAFWFAAALIIGDGMPVYFLQGLWGDSNEANIRESRLMTLIPVLTIYGIRLAVRVLRGTRAGPQV